MQLWLAGRATPPDRVFLKLVDIVLADDIARATQDRRKDMGQRATFPLGPASEEELSLRR